MNQQPRKFSEKYNTASGHTHCQLKYIRYSLGPLRGILNIDGETAPGLLEELLSFDPLLGADMADFRDQGRGAAPI